ncbi:TetR/AcrR family transcriptional regulator [Kitasatospora sp. NPDC004799]|uniref:TetR/AcrR family transcriptional regulator n=1 Tax=Kitasatospora sp. NPDC004799 TaxID=3154460 RepID=UPI0033B0702F
MAGVRGQGRKFDLEDILEKAMFVFWRHGYDGASVSTLTKEMGIGAPSLYAAFGSKEGLFLAVVEHYNNGWGGFMQRAFEEEEHAHDLIRRLLYEAAEVYAHADCPGGCLIIGSATRVSEAGQPVAERLREMRNANIDRLADRIGADVEAGVLPAGVDARAVAEFTGAIVQGMSHRARDGATVATLRTVAEQAWEAARVLLGGTRADPAS